MLERIPGYLLGTSGLQESTVGFSHISTHLTTQLRVRCEEGEALGDKVLSPRLHSEVEKAAFNSGSSDSQICSLSMPPPTSTLASLPPLLRANLLVTAMFLGYSSVLTAPSRGQLEGGCFVRWQR